MRSVLRDSESVQTSESLPRGSEDRGRDASTSLCLTAPEEVEESNPGGARSIMGCYQGKACQVASGREAPKEASTEGEGEEDFFKEPFQCTRQLLDEKGSGKLPVSREDLEHQIKGQYPDLARDHVAHPDIPKTPFDTPPPPPPRLSEVQDILKRARAASAPGLNGLPYKVYKNCPQVRKILWKLMEKQAIPTKWQKVVGIFISKEQNSTNISQFRTIALLDVEGKIFFSVLARRLASFLSNNCYIDTSCQKAGLPGFPGCLLSMRLGSGNRYSVPKGKRGIFMWYGSTSPMPTAQFHTSWLNSPWSISACLNVSRTS